MLGLPKSTEIAQQLPKKALFQKFELKSAQRDHFDADISKLTLVNAISQNKLPALQKGETIETIYVVDVALKRPNYDPKNIQMLSKLIPQKMLFALHYEDEIQLAIYHTKLICGSWVPADAYELELVGTTTDLVWENLVKTIGGIEIEEGNTLVEQIITDEEREKLRKQIDALEVKSRQEKQPRRKLEMFEELQELKKQYGKD